MARSCLNQVDRECGRLRGGIEVIVAVGLVVRVKSRCAALTSRL
jgi:hypothetical protein